MVKPRELTAATTLTEADSGKTIFLNSTTEFAVTLPKVKSGLNFNFIVKAAPSGASYTITAQEQNVVYGQIYTTDVNSATDPDFNIYAGKTVTFADGVSVVGDSAKFISDGTYWYMKGFCSVYNAMTITLSTSRSASTSPSTSPSVSPSASRSVSRSASPSTSPSVSPSASKSVSPSHSPSTSPSTSPSSS